MKSRFAKKLAALVLAGLMLFGNVTVAVASEYDGGYEFHGLPVEFAGISFGDLNGDDIVNYLDIIYLAQFIVHGYAANLPDRRAADLRTNGSTVVPTLLSSLITLARHSISGEEPLGPRPGSLTVLPVDGFGTPVYTAEIELIINGEPVGTFRTNTGVLSFNNVEEGDTVKLIVSRFDTELNETVTNTVTINSFDPYTNAAQVVVLGEAATVAVGVQRGSLNAGTAGSAAFAVETANINDGTYAVTLTGAPAGMTASDITITDGVGTLTVNTTAAVTAGTRTVTATINGVVSDSFTVRVNAPVNLGSWRNHTNAMTVPDRFMEYGENIMRFTVTAAANEAFAVRVNAGSLQLRSYSLRVLNPAGIEIVRGGIYRNNPTTQIGFLLARIDASPSQNRVYTVEVSRAGTGFQEGTSMRYNFRILFENREPSRMGNVTVAPTPATAQISVAANPLANVNGTISSSITLDLRENTLIPENSIISTIETRTTTPSGVNAFTHEIRHRLTPTATWSVWHRPIQLGDTGLYDSINRNHNIQARSIWEFRVTSWVTSSFNVSNIRFVINYLSDPTLAYLPWF